jgi:hypothetical protein
LVAILLSADEQLVVAGKEVQREMAISNGFFLV